jgi:integrase/recombinase XerD
MENIIIVKKAIFETENRIAIFIPKKKDMIEKIRKVPKREWSNRHLCWHFPYNADNWGIFKSLFKDFSFDIRKEEAALVIAYAEMVSPPQLTLKNEPEKAVDNTMLSHQIESFESMCNTPNITQIEASKTLELISEKSNIIQQNDDSNKLLVTKADFWKGRLRLDFIYRPDWVKIIKQFENRRWHDDQKCWTIPHSPFTIDTLKRLFGHHLNINIEQNDDSIRPHFISPYKIETPPQYSDQITLLEERMILKRMSNTTIKTYKNHFKQFIAHYNSIKPEDITHQQILDYMLFRIKTHKISESDQNSIISAIKCYFELVLGRERTYYDLKRPNKAFKLPNVLSEDEMRRLLTATENIKHKCILLAIYSAGLRLSELTNLRKQDLLLDDKLICVKSGKGKKDRMTLLSDTLLQYLDIYYQHHKPIYWLFEGQEGGQYSNRSVQKILRDSVVKSNVNPLATVHTLRHSFATHLINKGVSLRHIQELMGHEKSTTTEIYTHLTGDQLKIVKSPLDNLNFQ